MPIPMQNAAQNAAQNTVTARPKRFTVEDYHRLTALGFLGEDDHIELIRGELIEMAARGAAHESCITRLLRVLPGIVGDRATLRCQSPIVLSFDGEPEPDFSILRNREDDYGTAHPTPEDVMMVMEVASSSLDYDREVKLPLYAEAGISHYWIFNLYDRHLETYSEPARLASGQFDYLDRRIVTLGNDVALPAFPEQAISLDLVFPPLAAR